jgi:Fic family protein
MDTVEGLKEAIAAKKARLDTLRPLSQASLQALQRSYDVELTYTSNALEGNTLTLRETAEVIEHGITVGGKTLREHLEAADHHDAVLWIRELAASTTPLGEATVCELHRRIVLRSQPEIAGIYSPHARRVAGSRAVFPNPAKVPELMGQLGAWLGQAPAGPTAAFEAHFKLASIHPFADGNGRTARLLTNLILLRSGFPPVAVRPEDRSVYLDALERASLAGDPAAFQAFMHERLDKTMAEYLVVLEEAIRG